MKSPAELGLKYRSWRDNQIKALSWLDNNLIASARSELHVKVLEAPTGTGKTGLILGLAAMHPELRFLVLCSTKLEQEQYLKQIESQELKERFASIKGQNNFHCPLKNRTLPETCEDASCVWVHVDEAPCQVGFQCPLKNCCPYYRQVARARKCSIIVTNYAYGLSMMNYTQNNSALGIFDVIVEDEGHVLDQELEKFISVRLSTRTVERHFGLSLPAYETVPEWKLWVKEHMVTTPPYSDDIEFLSQNELKHLAVTRRYAKYFRMIEEMDDDWIVEADKTGYEFKPVWVTGNSREVLFQHAPRHIIMSGTIPSSSQLGRKVGIKLEDFEFLRLPYVFPVEHRPIILVPSVDLDYKVIDQNLGQLTRVVDNILGNNLKVKSLIHTKSYKIANYLFEHSEYSHLMIIHDARNRIEKLNEFKLSPKPRVLVSPSMDRAIDLPGDECELVIICKIPYPFLGSKVMQKRVKQSREYYLHETLASIIQMAGRGVRTETDIAPTYIVDAAAPRFFKQVRSMTPEAIKKAIRNEGME